MYYTVQVIFVNLERLTNDLEKFPLFAVLENPAVAVSVCHEEHPGGFGDCDRCWFAEMFLVVTGNEFLAQNQVGFFRAFGELK